MHYLKALGILLLKAVQSLPKDDFPGAAVSVD
jgi:hypothetical protein